MPKAAAPGRRRGGPTAEDRRKVLFRQSAAQTPPSWARAKRLFIAPPPWQRRGRAASDCILGFGAGRRRVAANPIPAWSRSVFARRAAFHRLPSISSIPSIPSRRLSSIPSDLIDSHPAPLACARQIAAKKSGARRGRADCEKCGRTRRTREPFAPRQSRRTPVGPAPGLRRRAPLIAPRGEILIF